MSAARFLSVLLALCFLSVGCTRYDLQQPTATLRDAEVGDVNADGFTMNFLVDVRNPNAIHLPLSNVKYDLDVAGVGVVNEQTVELTEGVPANGSAVVAVPIAVRFEDLLKAERAIASSGGDIPYNLTGSLDFTGASLFSDLNVPINYSGTIPLRQIVSDPEALLRSPAARELSQRLLGALLGP